MKRIISILIAAAALVWGLAGCTAEKASTTPMKSVDLRYTAEDSYSLDAYSPKAINIVVKSSDPWTVKSIHPDWCIISREEGPASEMTPDGAKYNVKIQYYDNIGLDDREDLIRIKSDYWVGKEIKVYQKGIAYISVPEEDLEKTLAKKDGSDTFQVISNQDWSAKVTEGDQWLSIAEGATGTKNGTVKLVASDNNEEMRYGAVTVYDRHDVFVAEIKVTQDGVQLEPATEEIRAVWDQDVYSLSVSANTAWTVAKKAGCEDDEWYTLEKTDFEGSDVLNIKMSNNEGGSIRGSWIVLKTKGGEGDYVATKEIWVRQANKLVPNRVTFDESQISQWSVTASTDWTGTPSFDDGMFMPVPTQVKRSMDPPGIYTIHWDRVVGLPVLRMWYVYSGQEIKYKCDCSAGETSISLNSAGGSLSGVTNAKFDPSSAVDMGIKVDPLPGGRCKVTFQLNGEDVYTFDTDEKVMSKMEWGKEVDLYFGVEGADGESAVCEWYDYTQPFSWDE